MGEKRSFHGRNPSIAASFCGAAAALAVAACSSHSPPQGDPAGHWAESSGDGIPVGSQPEDSDIVWPEGDARPLASIAAGPVKRTHKLAVLLGNFSNNPTEQPATKEHVRAKVFTAENSANAFWKEASYGYREFVGALDPAGDIFGYYTLNSTNDNCDGNYRAFGDQLEAKAREAGVDLSVYDNVMLVFVAQCRNRGELAGRRTWMNAIQFGPEWDDQVKHELGHNLGLAHANGYFCKNQEDRWVPISNRCQETEYWDHFDVMGTGYGTHPNGYYHPNVWGKAKLGFLQPSAIATVAQSGTYSLSPSFQTDGTQSLRILREIVDGTPLYYYLEYRRPSGYFDDFASTDPAVNGVTIRLAQDHANGAFPMPTRLVDSVPYPERSPGNPDARDATLAAGQTYDDAVTGLRITVDSLSAQGARVRITVPPPLGPGNGTGLRGEYFDNANFTGTKLTRTDPTVNFDWTGSAPDPSMGGTDFSVRWTGQVLVQSSGVHTFTTTSDDGVRLWVDGKLLIDNWTSHPPTENSAQVALDRGKRYAIRMEYYQGQSNGIAKLEWATPTGARAILPRTQLVPSGQIMFASGFETADTPPTWLDVFVPVVGVTSPRAYVQQAAAQSGLRSLLYSGNDASSSSSFTHGKIFDVSIPVSSDTELSYFVRPTQPYGAFVVVNLNFADGHNPGTLGAVDQFGIRLDAQSQGRGGRLALGAWTQIRSNIGAVAAGRTIDTIRVTYDQPENTGVFSGAIDDIVIR